MSVLAMYWLVQWCDVQSSYVMHKLVHAWALERLEETQQRQLSVAVLNQLGNVTSRTLKANFVTNKEGFSFVNPTAFTTLLLAPHLFSKIVLKYALAAEATPTIPTSYQMCS